jgi:hypothetical protein
MLTGCPPARDREPRFAFVTHGRLVLATTADDLPEGEVELTARPWSDRPEVQRRWQGETVTLVGAEGALCKARVGEVEGFIMALDLDGSESPPGHIPSLPTALLDRECEGALWASPSRLGVPSVRAGRAAPAGLAAAALVALEALSARFEAELAEATAADPSHWKRETRVLEVETSRKGVSATVIIASLRITTEDHWAPCSDLLVFLEVTPAGLVQRGSPEPRFATQVSALDANGDGGDELLLGGPSIYDEEELELALFTGAGDLWKVVDAVSPVATYHGMP